MLGEVVVKIEATIETWGKRPAIQYYRANECCRVVTVLLQQFGPGGVGRGQGNGEISYSVHAGQQPGKNGRVRSVRDRTRRECLREANSILGEHIERRSLDPIVAVTMNMVGAKRINRHQEYIGLRRPLLRGLACETAANQQQQTQEDSAGGHRNSACATQPSTSAASLS